MRGIKSKSTVTDRTVNAYQQALRLLTGRDYTVAAMTGKLRLRGCDEADILLTIERLQQERFLDDRRYAERFVESARQSGKYVGYRLRLELRRRGLNKELIDSVTTDCHDLQSEYAMAFELVSRRYPSFSGPKSEAGEKRRIAGFLQRRGFSSALIRSVIMAQGQEEGYE